MTNVLYVQPVVPVANEAEASLKQQADNHLINTHGFTRAKQDTFTIDYIDFNVALINSTITTEQQTKLTHLQSVFPWRAAVYAECDRVLALVTVATTAAEVNTAMASLSFPSIAGVDYP